MIETMGDVFRDGKEIIAEKRQNRKADAVNRIDEVRQLADSLTIDENGTWNISRGPHRIQFYPTKGRWQYRNATRGGGIDTFIAWLTAL